MRIRYGATRAVLHADRSQPDRRHPPAAASAGDHRHRPPPRPNDHLLALSSVALAIPGTGAVAHLEENLTARSITLTEEDLADLA
jgi:hypothetical protein